MTCVWEFDPACVEDAWAAFDPETQDRSLMLATSALQMLTYYRVGTCPVTIRPCPEPKPCECAWEPYGVSGYGTTQYHPYNWAGLWYNHCTHRSTCKPISEIDIPGPVGYVDSFKINGVEQDLVSGNWRLDDGHLLVWQGEGDSPLPATQDLNKPDTAPGTYSITYSNSYPVGPDAELAVAYLAVEFAKACTPRSKCSLPRGVTNVVRNGVSFTIEAGLFPGGLTGIEVVDQFILKWAPAGSPTRNASVFDPRRGSGPRRTSSVPLRSTGSL